MKAPAFQLYPQDFISSLDVQLMSAAEVGAYCLLLFNSWTQPRQGFLPNDEAQLRHLSRLSSEEWKISKKRLLAKFPATDDKKHRYNPRLIVEAEKQAAFREKQTEHGKRGGRPRQDEKPDKANPFLGESQNNPTLSQPLGKPKPARAHSSSSTSSSTSSSEELSSLRSEDAATAAVSQPEKKAEEKKAEAMALAARSTLTAEHFADDYSRIERAKEADASHTRGAANVPTRISQRAARPVLVGPLADLVNAGGLAEAVQGMKKPFTQDEADTLLDAYGEDAARGIVQEMANYAKLGNNVSAYLTARKWLDKRIADAFKNSQSHDHSAHHRPQNGAAGYGQRSAPAVHANPFGLASPQSIAIARAVVMGGTDPNFGLDL